MSGLRDSSALFESNDIIFFLYGMQLTQFI